uniref:Uncharacterized protein n=1 Tax=Phytophthora ramorum TaxID=164328 RepID=H3GKM3_PHYRM
MRSYLQLGGLSRDLGEHYRAVDYYKPALAILKTFREDEHIDQIRSVTQAMLQLHLQTLSAEKRNIIEKTATRYSQQWPRFALVTRKVLPENTDISGLGDDVGEESTLLIFAMKKLFQLEPIEYIDQLIEKTDLEFQDYRKQYNLNFAGTLRRNNADAPSPQHALLRSSSGRFASFSGAGTFSPPGSPRAPLSPMRHPTLFPASPCSNGRTSFNQLDCNFLKTATGDFTFGGQLAAVLFLIDHPSTNTTTPATESEKQEPKIMAPVPAWTKEWRPLAKQLCAHISDTHTPDEGAKRPLPQEALLLRADRVVGQFYSHRFVDTLPQDVQQQTEALATKFRVHSLEDRADKLLQLSPHCDCQVLKLLLELATSPTTAVDEDVDVDEDADSRWKTVLQQEQLKQKQHRQMQDQLVDELFQISTNDEWYQAWEESDEESDWEMSSVGRERSVDSCHRNGKRTSEALEEEGDAIGGQEVMPLPDSRVSSVLASGESAEHGGTRREFSEGERLRDNVLCRYHPEVLLRNEEDMVVDDAEDPTCVMEKSEHVPFTLDRPWLLCEAVVKSAEGGWTTSGIIPRRLIHEQTVFRFPDDDG